jgi:YfiH family protein
MSGQELLLELPGSGRVLFTGRAEGNLSSTRGEDRERGEAAREELRLRIGALALARADQVHGANVRLWREPPVGDADAHEEGDGHATAVCGLGLTVLTADCLPVAIGAPGAVAMLHAGWRGLAAGILEQGVSALEEAAGRPAEIVAILGPCAGVCCYEVGPEVHAALGRRPGASRNLNLREIARERLLTAGVSEVLDAEACTICDERFFSHRREGARAGRQGGVAWLS